MRKDNPEEKAEIRKKILRTFQQTTVPLTYQDAMRDLKGRNSRLIPIAREVMADLLMEGIIEKFNRTKYILAKSQRETVTGEISITKSKSGFVTPDGEKVGDHDIMIDMQEVLSNNIIDGDRVEVVIKQGKDYKGRKFGNILRLVKRRTKPVVGIIYMRGNDAILETHALKATERIFIPRECIRGAKEGEKVAVRIIDWPKKSKNPNGRVIEILGKPGENETEMHAILSEFDLPYKYPDRLERIADKIEAEISEEEIAKRRDMRGICTFTIDPATAKDFDDALSIRKIENGNWEVGVHIADVTHYVEKGSDIDAEGYQRATSVYLVDRTIPMLPEKLSNFLCSLRPNEDKLCYSAIFELNQEAEIKSKWFGRTVIHSMRRFDYDQAQEIIEGKSDELKEEIQTLDMLAKKLRKARAANGAINFERDEPQFELDENGKPLRMYFRQEKDSNRLIEEFMLLANRSVAELVASMKKTFVYRVHDLPEKDKYEKFANFIQRFGYSMRSVSTKKAGEELTSLLGKVKGKAEESLISMLAIRTMAKAVYSTHNIGHYGLAFKYYTHFTSPIRRYPDMMVHRLLDRYLAGKPSVSPSEWEDYCKYCSEQETKAADAERASIKYKMVEFMEDKTGNEYDGMISGLTDWGMYVEIEENRIEGMVSLRSIPGDFYFLNHEDFVIEASRTGRKFQIGERVRIRVDKADLEHKQLDFAIIGVYTANGTLDTISQS